ncbi:hypothetical protein EK21DRAFT_58234 [Setomelanomma holmii]|uniref:Uncharacterized protein n=1 Tax=Setomelanomma holmii TaxID=210430 RepID=A0A9P4HIH5_9PLEO|nr:hypothetical protein EK21DRAFT_58234 [Setomelanomma holmii]
MSWMDSWSRPGKHAATPPPLYLTVGDSVPYCHSCGRVISERKKHSGSEVKYCSSRCRNNKPGPIDRKIEAAFAALLNGATPEALKDGSAAAEQEKARIEAFKKEDGKKHKKKSSKSMKGDHRPIIECQTVEGIVFQREKDPEKVYGRRKNRKARFVVEKPEDWKSVDMVDKPEVTPNTTTASTSTATSQKPASLTSDDDNDKLSDSDSEEQEGGIVLETPKAPNPTAPNHNHNTNTTTNQDEPDLPDAVEYGYGSGKIRPPQHANDVNGSVGGEKGWAERIEETEDMKAKRREGQKRADEREMVRKAARRGCAFGFIVDGEGNGDGDKRKCEAVMKGTVVEASFAKGEWGVRWREKV